MPSARLLYNHLSLSIDIFYAALNPQSQQLNNDLGTWFGLVPEHVTSFKSNNSQIMKRDAKRAAN